MRNGSSGHDERGWSPTPQHPYARSPERQAPERELPYGPEVSWPFGFPQMNFDTGEYRRLVDGYSQADPGYGDPGYADPRYDGQGQYNPGRPQPGAPRYEEPLYPATGQQEILREPYAEA